MSRVTFLCLLLTAVSASPAYAQRDRLLVEPKPPAEWGITFSFQPSWELKPTSWAPLIGATRSDIEAPDGSSTLGGSTWSIGFARGRAFGGDWGISFSQTRIRRDAVLDRLSTCPPPDCFTDKGRITFRDVTAIGPEVHFYIPFATFKDRIQPGIELAGGIAKFRGLADYDSYEYDTNVFPPRSVATHASGEIGDLTYYIYMDSAPWQFLGRVEPGVAVIVSPRVKVHAGMGFHFPGMTYFSLKTTYFFPRNAP